MRKIGLDEKVKADPWSEVANIRHPETALECSARGKHQHGFGSGTGSTVVRHSVMVSWRWDAEAEGNSCSYIMRTGRHDSGTHNDI